MTDFTSILKYNKTNDTEENSVSAPVREHEHEQDNKDSGRFLFSAVHKSKAVEKRVAEQAQESSDRRRDDRDVNFSARLYQTHYGDPDVWKKEEEGKRAEPLYRSFGGRVAIRTFSRGLLGSAAFAAGDAVMRNYDWRAVDLALEKGKGRAKTVSFMHRNLGRIAKAIDFVAGRPIKATVKFLTGSEEKAQKFVTFRQPLKTSPTRAAEFAKYAKAKNLDPYYDRLFGHSLGHESVRITFDFACGSAGDALGRDLVALADPNVKKDIYDENGNISFKKIGLGAARSAWDIISYRQMEDWAIAVPYAFWRRGARKAIAAVNGKDKMGTWVSLCSPDTGTHLKIDSKGSVTGDYLWQGAAYFQTRFMGYEFLALIWRDAYNGIANWFMDVKEHGLHAPRIPDNPITSISETTLEAFNYVVKSAIKAFTYMLPAVPFYWLPRQPQHLDRAAYIEGETGRFISDRPGFTVSMEGIGVKYHDGMQAHMLRSEDIVPNHEYYLGRDRVTEGPAARGDSKYPYRYHKHPEASKLARYTYFMNNANDAVRNRVAPLLEKMGVDKEVAAGAARTYTNSMFAYTPYMIAKYEFGNLWDTPQMDASIYRMIDGVEHLNLEEIKAGFKDYTRVLTLHPVSKITQEKAYEGRGLFNTRQAQREAEKRSAGYEIEKTHHDIVKERKARKRHIEKVVKENDPLHILSTKTKETGNSSAWSSKFTPSNTSSSSNPDNQKDATNLDNSNREKAAQSSLPDNNGLEVDNDSWQRLISTDKDAALKGAPPNVTLH